MASMDDILEITKAYSALGWAVQEQIETVLDYGRREPGSVSEAEYEGYSANLNPAAVAMIRDDFVPALVNAGEDEAAEELRECCESWLMA